MLLTFQHETDFLNTNTTIPLLSNPDVSSPWSMCIFMFPVICLPGTMLPPITSAYKRKYEDEDEEEYDPEMDDFIDDGGEGQEEISKHIKEIFGYDRKR